MKRPGEDASRAEKEAYVIERIRQLKDREPHLKKLLGTILNPANREILPAELVVMAKATADACDFFPPKLTLPEGRELQDDFSHLRQPRDARAE